MPKEYLKISEFAALSGISRKLLIFYDNNRILHPAIIDRENGYRYYSYRQIDTASVIVSLREAGMSLDGIREYLTNKSPRNLISTLESQEAVLEHQIRKLNQIKGMIHARIAQTERGLDVGSDHIRVVNFPAENLFLGPVLPDSYDVADGWTYLPDFYSLCMRQDIQLGFAVGTMVLKENLLHKRWNKPACYFYRLPATDYPNYFIKPEGHYVVGAEYTDYGRIDSLYKRLLHYIGDNGLTIGGNAYEEFLIDEVSEKNPERYLLQIAIQVSDAS